MHPELQKLEDSLKKYKKESFTKLSEDRHQKPLVTNDVLAYNFDTITQSLYAIPFASADALLLRDNLYFIEFKNFTESDEEKNQMILQHIFLKCGESLFTLHRHFLNSSLMGEDHFKKAFVLVVNSNTNPLEATANVMLKISNNKVHKTKLRQRFENYCQKDKQDKPYFYDEVIILNDQNFNVWEKNAK